MIVEIPPLRRMCRYTYRSTSGQGRNTPSGSCCRSHAIDLAGYPALRFPERSGILRHDRHMDSESRRDAARNGVKPLLGSSRRDVANRLEDETIVKPNRSNES